MHLRFSVHYADSPATAAPAKSGPTKPLIYLRKQSTWSTPKPIPSCQRQCPNRVNGACMDINEVRFVQIAPSILDLGARQSTAYEATNYRVRWLHVRWLLSTPV
ncbi:hypothetical protein LMH87_010691 [Akanthomyces muscarius]|uniref:Uncharacterized protein n=1 Tax=Akanthomyces muscarius TaxID=2231603 RepID=A0A9W8UJ99_AKAMU|nr:hypothetical protein LMH87_010691 [Akanthomyces muscarius]KAJ4149917.1 hypothetical protein LMH87_010691 [Akanthomyces muscarius]